MRKLFKIILISALLSCAAMGLRQAQGQRDGKFRQSSATIVSSNRLHGDVGVNVNDNSFILKNLKLSKMLDSTILKGYVVNKTNRTRDEVSFEVRAYDRSGQILKGLERETIFAVRQLKANASAPINQGYGVWLQGIPLEAVARIEILETNGETTSMSSMPSWTKWLSNHAVSLEKDSEIEE
jgi:hypothetical protein